MSKDEAVERWQQSADKNLKTASDLQKLRHHDWTLFIGQLALEKLLKGLILTLTDENPPKIHELNKLAEIAGIQLNQEQTDDFTEISRFHIQARYDDIKYELYKTATEKYTTYWFNKITYYYQWLKSLY